jgi:hypothetical protein
MGRKRIDPDEKKVRKHIYIKKSYSDLLDEKNINLSKLVEKLLKKYLNL